MDTQTIQDSIHKFGANVRNSSMAVMEHVHANQRVLIKTAIVVIFLSGWIYAAWSGGLMGIWASFCSGIIGYLAGIFAK